MMFKRKFITGRSDDMVKNTAVDSGKYATKIAVAKDGNIEHGKFRTCMDRDIEKSSSDIGTYGVEFEGKKYLLGNQARNQDFSDSKHADIHRIATYTALASDYAGLGHGDHVNVAIGCTLQMYANKDIRKAYKNFIAPQNTDIDIVVNGKRKLFHIDRSFVFPESSGVIYLNPEKYADSVVGVIDIGGLNANCCIYENLVPKAGSDVFTCDLGGNILSRDTAMLVEQTGTGHLSDYLIDRMMIDNGLKKGSHEASAKIVRECKLKHVQKIYDECIRHGWNLDFTEIVFTGGSANWLKDEIMQVFPYYDIDNLDSDADFKNVDGYLMQMLSRLHVAI